MRCGRYLLAVLMTVCLVSCGLTAEEEAMKKKCESLVTQRANTNRVVEAFGVNPKYTFTRDKAFEYFQQQGGELWKRTSQYPLTYAFPMHSGEVLVYFDDGGNVVAYYLNIQL